MAKTKEKQSELEIKKYEFHICYRKNINYILVVKAESEAKARAKAEQFVSEEPGRELIEDSPKQEAH